MSHQITENDIEALAIKYLEKQGFHSFFGPDIAPDGKTPLRSNYESPLLIQHLQSAIDRLNPHIPIAIQQDTLNQIQQFSATPLMNQNKAFHKNLTTGWTVHVRKDNETYGDKIYLIDFQNPENNTYHVVNQFTVQENQHKHRSDIVLFVNGLPLVVMELKNPVQEKSTLLSAYKQLKTYKQNIPSLFVYNSILVISDGLTAKAGALSSEIDRFMPWKSLDGRITAPTSIHQMETLIKGKLNKKTLLDLIQNFITFEQVKTQHKGITVLKSIKKLASYHQYFAANKAVESIIQASSENGHRKGGVIWHTQGSGKSLTMMFATGKIVQKLNNPTIVVITDRNDLDNQLFDTFSKAQFLLRQVPQQATSRKHLKQLLKVKSGGIVFTTIHKFYPEEGNVYESLSNRKNIVVMADEAHRTQYGFKAKIIDDINKQGQTIGQKTLYGFAKYMRSALPHATFMGWTGTPVENTDKNTPAVFGSYIDVYDIAQAVEDKATVPIYYESRLAKVELSQKGQQLIAELDQELNTKRLSETQKAKAKFTQVEAIVGSDNRIKRVAKDIITHFTERQKVCSGKGMIVVMSRRIAVKLYDEISKLKPKWHDDNLHKGSIKVVMTASATDGPDFFKHRTSKEDRRQLADRIKEPNDTLQLVIVVDMWLTGFDVPCLHTLYIDKPMQGHNLMQAIARVNRVYKDKPGGLVVDYLGIASDLKKALSFYSKSRGKGDPAILQEQAISLFLEKIEIISQMFHRFGYKKYFKLNTSEKLSFILSAQEHILNQQDGKSRFIKEVTALSKAFALSMPSKTALDRKEEVAFFQAIKARLVKFTNAGESPTSVEVETLIRQVIDQALLSHQVIDVFSAAGIKKPDISILSDEFLMEMKNYKHKNIAIETLKKLLNDEIKGRINKNLIQGQTLMEMLKKALNRYHNKIITTTEVMEELIHIAKEIRAQDSVPKEMNLTEEEYAFYTAVADNSSAKELMSHEQLRALSLALMEKVRQNTSIDWQIKESARAKLRVMVKRTLKEYGYPPDRQKLAVDNVLKQAETLANMMN